MEKEVKTNIGSIPYPDYLDIIAQQSGFEDYSDMLENGCYITPPSLDDLSL